MTVRSRARIKEQTCKQKGQSKAKKKKGHSVLLSGDTANLSTYSRSFKTLINWLSVMICKVNKQKEGTKWDKYHANYISMSPVRIWGLLIQGLTCASNPDIISLSLLMKDWEPILNSVICLYSLIFLFFWFIEQQALSIPHGYPSSHSLVKGYECRMQEQAVMQSPNNSSLQYLLKLSLICIFRKPTWQILH